MPEPNESSIEHPGSQRKLLRHTETMLAASPLYATPLRGRSMVHRYSDVRQQHPNWRGHRELAELLQFINDWLTTDQDARITLDRFTGRAYSAQSLRADLSRFTAVILAYREPADPTPDC